MTTNRPTSLGAYLSSQEFHNYHEDFEGCGLCSVCGMEQKFNCHPQPDIPLMAAHIALSYIIQARDALRKAAETLTEVHTPTANMIMMNTYQRIHSLESIEEAIQQARDTQHATQESL